MGCRIMDKYTVVFLLFIEGKSLRQAIAIKNGRIRKKYRVLHSKWGKSPMSRLNPHTR